MTEDTYRGKPGDALSLNLYTYCNNNPLIYWDPSGHAVSQSIKLTIRDTISPKHPDYDYVQKYGRYPDVLSSPSNSSSSSGSGKSSSSNGSVNLDDLSAPWSKSSSSSLVFVSMPNGSTKIGIIDANGKTRLANKYGEYTVDLPEGALVHLGVKNSNDIKSNVVQVAANVGGVNIEKTLSSYGGSFSTKTYGSGSSAFTINSMSAYGMNDVLFNISTTFGTTMGMFTDASGTNRNIHIVKGSGGYRVADNLSAEALYVYLVESNGKQIANAKKNAYVGNGYNLKEVSDLQKKRELLDNQFNLVMYEDALRKAMNITADYEGTDFTGVEGNFDGMGITMGIFGWNMGTGTLQPLFNDMNTNHRTVL